MLRLVSELGIKSDKLVTEHDASLSWVPVGVGFAAGFRLNPQVGRKCKILRREIPHFLQQACLNEGLSIGREFRRRVLIADKDAANALHGSEWKAERRFRKDGLGNEALRKWGRNRRSHESLAFS